MLRRLIYHSFWNFYDHLGLYVFCGIVHGLLSIGLVIMVLDASVMGIQASWVALLAMCVPLIITLAFLLPFSARVARGEPVRWADFWRGGEKHFFKFGIVCLTLLAAIMLLLINLRFYLLMQDKSNPYLFTTLAALDGWLIVLTCCLFWPFLCAMTAPETELQVRKCVYKAQGWIVLVPSVWLCVGLAGVALLWAAVFSRAGLLIYLPVMVVLAQTAAFLTAQFIDFLAVARDEAEGTTSISSLKHRAGEMALEWEAKQPRRTFKELIKPWEY